MHDAGGVKVASTVLFATRSHGLECRYRHRPRGFRNAAMPGPEIIGIIILGALAWLWFDSLRAREAAVRAARAACAAEGLMLLDDTVAIANLKPARDDNGRFILQRAYDFEFSDTGNNRLQGSVVLRGHRVILLNVGSHLAPAERTLY